MHVFPECPVVEAVSEGKLFETVSVFSQSVYHKLMELLGISQPFVDLDLLPVLVNIGSVVVPEKSGIYSARVRRRKVYCLRVKLSLVL